MTSYPLLGRVMTLFPEDNQHHVQADSFLARRLPQRCQDHIPRSQQSIDTDRKKTHETETENDDENQDRHGTRRGTARRNRAVLSPWLHEMHHDKTGKDNYDSTSTMAVEDRNDRRGLHDSDEPTARITSPCGVDM
ncbi:uncharacterized protein ARMOST_16189 [Armillaria ostoyae]|uniref:Uncharacterized protein n=1 Tax=Armillaria ostoyae TaxID=47428 RepID=A0A284RVG2_ARMOS|nr:uncharacterized protein ARMOST_16189 [Armillaria ostoyae]